MKNSKRENQQKDLKKNSRCLNQSQLNSGEKWCELLNIMEKLRGENGCPWDKEQTHESLKRYLIEESYEVIDAIDSGKGDKIADELGDLLLQVVFHSQLGKEAGLFNADDVLDSINNKMVRRHPHVFGEAGAEDSQEVLNLWELQKANERVGAKKKGLMDVNYNLPALMLAQKVQEKASRVGFDWENINGPWGKLKEEIKELEAAKTPEERHEELGDCLFALINISRFMDIDAEDALRHTVKKFISRFKHIEKELEKSNTPWAKASLEDLDKLWDEAKELERKFENKSLK